MQGHDMMTPIMTREIAAKALDGGQYREEGSKELFAEMAKVGLVAVFGASDDAMEFRGSIDDEVGCYGGGIAHIYMGDLLKSRCHEGDDCPYFQELKEKARTVKAVWDKDGFSWVYETAIDHSTFVIKDGEDDYCRGIVFTA